MDILIFRERTISFEIIIRFRIRAIDIHYDIKYNFQAITKHMISQPTFFEFELDVEMDKLDSPLNFNSDFSCPELQKLFSKATTSNMILENKNIFNKFFKRMMSTIQFPKSFYGRFKWLIFLHGLIDSFPEKSRMYCTLQQALETYLECLEPIEKVLQNYEKYLARTLFRPYFQYLIKLCQLEMEEDKYSLEFSSEQLAEWNNYRWYKEYNFLIWSVETFAKPMMEVKTFFTYFYPYLNMFGVRIHSNLTNRMKDLKLRYDMQKQLRELVSIFDISQLEAKIQNKQVSQEKLQKTEEGEKQQLPDFEEQITEFLNSPLIPIMKRKQRLKAQLKSDQQSSQ